MTEPYRWSADWFENELRRLVRRFVSHPRAAGQLDYYGLALALAESVNRLQPPAPTDPAPTADSINAQIDTFALRACREEEKHLGYPTTRRALAEHVANNWAQVVQGRQDEQKQADRISIEILEAKVDATTKNQRGMEARHQGLQARLRYATDRIAALEQTGDALAGALQAERVRRGHPGVVTEAETSWWEVRQCPPEQPYGLKSLLNEVAADDYPDVGGVAPPPEGWQKLAQALSAKVKALETEPRPDWPSRARLQTDWGAQAAEILDRETERLGERMLPKHRLLVAQVAATLAVAEEYRAAAQQPDEIDRLTGDLQLARRNYREKVAELGAAMSLIDLGRKVVEMAKDPLLKLESEAADALDGLLDAAKPLIEKGEQDGE